MFYYKFLHKTGNNIIFSLFNRDSTKWAISERGYRFFLEGDDETPWESWVEKLNKIDLYKYQILQEYLDNSWAKILNNSVTINAEDLYTDAFLVDQNDLILSEYEQPIRLLNLPPFYSGKIYIKYTGELHGDNLEYKISFCGNVTSMGPDEIYPYKRKAGLIVDRSINEIIYTLNPFQYQFVKLIETYNGLEKKEKTLRNNLDYLSQLKSIGARV